MSFPFFLPTFQSLPASALRFWCSNGYSNFIMLNCALPYTTKSHVWQTIYTKHSVDWLSVCKFIQNQIIIHWKGLGQYIQGVLQQVSNLHRHFFTTDSSCSKLINIEYDNVSLYLSTLYFFELCCPEWTRWDECNPLTETTERFLVCFYATPSCGAVLPAGR